MFAGLGSLILAIFAFTAAQSQELPEFYGVYAVHNDKLIELKRNPQSDNYTNPLGGADIIRSLSGITFPDSDLSFIIFSPQVASLATEIWVNIMAPIRNAPPPSFHIQSRGWVFRVAPIPNQPQMVKLVRKGGIKGGHLALMLPSGLYDFVVNQPPDPDGICVERVVSFIGGGVIYQPCGAQQGEPGQQPLQERTTRGTAQFQQLLSSPPVVLYGATTYRTDSGRPESWTMKLRITSYDQSSNKFAGEIEWNAMHAVHRVEGSFDGRTLIFREVDFIKKGEAGLGCVYTLHIQDEQKLNGTWEGCDGSSKKGTTFLSLK